MRNRILFVLILLVLCILISSSCVKYTDGIKELNENSNLDYNFAEDGVSLRMLDGFIMRGDSQWPYYEFISYDSLTKYTISGYPDYSVHSDKYKVTGFTTKNPKYSIYGVSVGAKVTDAIRLLKSKSFMKYTEDPLEYALSYKNGKVIIYIYFKDSKVYGIYTQLEVKNAKYDMRPHSEFLTVTK